MHFIRKIEWIKHTHMFRNGPIDVLNGNFSSHNCKGHEHVHEFVFCIRDLHQLIDDGCVFQAWIRFPSGYLL